MEAMYNAILCFFRKNPVRQKYMILFCKYIPYITAISYAIIVLYLLFIRDDQVILVLVKPLLVFLLVTIFRKLFNRPRPYETLNIHPLFKHKQGESFPSRHTASAFIIALVGYSLFPLFGVFLLIIASLVALTRVLAGIHYISDVLIAIIISYSIWII